VRQALSSVYYGPPDWLVTKFDSRQRRAFGFWNVVFAAVLSVPFGNKVWYVTILSVVALIPNFSTETPVEEEGEQ
jgi:hypothetical protein